MTKTRKLLIFTAVGILGVFAASWFLLLSPKRAEASQLRAQDQAAQEQIAHLNSQLAELKAQAEDVPAQDAQLVRLGKQIPSDPELPDLIRNLRKRANDTDVELVSIKPSAPMAYTSTTATSTTSSTSDTTTTGDGLMTVPLEVDISGSYAELENFVLALEDMQRSFLVTGFDITGSAAATSSSSGSDPSASSGGAVGSKGPLTVTITGEVFTAPEADVPSIPAGSSGAAK
jgi:type IV pilus assembly protein PilO